jgi:TM2 domain-containing membrane protein YozV
MSETTATGRGSTGNVIAALCSLFIAGLGQLVQGRVLWALFWFVFAGVAWAITGLLTLGFFPFGGAVVHLLSCIHAALYKPAA